MQIQIDRLEHNTGGELPDRCKAIYDAFQQHYISFKDMEYALMQYERFEADAGNLRSDRPMPKDPNPRPKAMTKEEREDYEDAVKSYRRADKKNYEGHKRLERLEEYDLAIADDDSDYSKGEDWAKYIIRGEVTGVVKEFIGEGEDGHTEQQA